jgi:hypothetical protein
MLQSVKAVIFRGQSLSLEADHACRKSNMEQPSPSVTTMSISNDSTSRLGLSRK